MLPYDQSRSKRSWAILRRLGHHGARGHGGSAARGHASTGARGRRGTGGRPMPPSLSRTSADLRPRPPRPRRIRCTAVRPQGYRHKGGQGGQAIVDTFDRSPAQFFSLSAKRGPIALLPLPCCPCPVALALLPLPCCHIAIALLWSRDGCRTCDAHNH